MIVVDASVLLEVLLVTPDSPKISSRLFADEETLAAPHLVDLEIAQVLRRYAAAGEIDAQRGREALLDFLDVPLLRYPHDVLLSRVWELRSNVTAYDAAYLALAEALDVPLLTRDSYLAGVPGHRARVELV
ncbi:MAG: type II toxin-antitoxin system VapC family toxin [Planctomycetes bacterium]|nr:type II toxin-antitoxin system VapC family toxin [Planctomycetota bacterium]